jgi:DNA polymerase-3 subunit gamma/tau
MSEYQVIARRFRPQLFRDVLGQEAIVTTLKNAIKNLRLAHAYLFCGSRGTGKTTLARIFAKAINCQNPTADLEPCNECSSCKEITGGHSLDVLEIDGASHRGIDDIRQINETVGYATASGKYKIYIIDEVHMLTKEAFNALLKTLEEPPPKVKFFFATTEPHKVPTTILSRCQRFNLNRIPTENIVGKLQRITKDMGTSIDEEALRLIAERAEGGLRDAESLLDQICTFQEGTINATSVASILGLVTRDTFFSLDKAGKEGNIAMSFEIANDVFAQGKDVIQFLESLTEHFRNILVFKLSGKQGAFLSVPENDREKYEASAKFYSQEQCLYILDFLIEAQNQQKFLLSGKIALEAILLRILRSHQRIPIEILVKRLADLEKMGGSPQESFEAAETVKTPSRTYEEPPKAQIKEVKEVEKVILPEPKPVQNKLASTVTEDPMPTKADLGIKEKAPSKPESSAPPLRLTSEQQSKFDTLLQFATIELEGTIQRKPLTR